MERGAEMNPIDKAIEAYGAAIHDCRSRREIFATARGVIAMLRALGLIDEHGEPLVVGSGAAVRGQIETDAQLAAALEERTRERDEARHALDAITQLIDMSRSREKAIDAARVARVERDEERARRAALTLLLDAHRVYGCRSLERIGEALGLDADDASAGEMVEAIKRLTTERDEVVCNLGTVLRSLEAVREQLTRERDEAQASARRAQEQAARDLGITPEGLETVRAVLTAWTPEGRREAERAWIAAGRPLGAGEP